MESSGKKVDLQERLRNSYIRDAKALVEATPPVDDDYESMETEDLRHTLRSRGLSTLGKSKETLIQRLRQDSETIRELMKAAPSEKLASLVNVMEAASRESLTLQEYLQERQSVLDRPSKFVDVTITSLGLEPEKFTAGGAPSVTSDVLRKLAGDPFADPPQYGSVSCR
jgi:SAP domain